MRAYIAAQPGIQKIPGPHGLTLLHHARKGGPEALAVVAFLEALGDADIQTVNRPISEEEMSVLTGTCTFAEGESGAIEISLKDGLLEIRRLPDGTKRTWFHRGEHTFHPAGAPAVQVRFSAGGSTEKELVVADGPLMVTARRIRG